MTETTFKRGDRVICRDTDGTRLLRKGEVYTVYRYYPPHHTLTFTYPAYVDIVFRDHQGLLRKSCYHAHRFVPV